MGMLKATQLLVHDEKTGTSNYEFVEKGLVLIPNRRQYNSRTFNVYGDFNKTAVAINCSVFYKGSFS